jgi:hypothetical protein
VYRQILLKEPECGARRLILVKLWSAYARRVGPACESWLKNKKGRAEALPFCCEAND